MFYDGRLAPIDIDFLLGDCLLADIPGLVRGDIYRQSESYSR